MSLGESSKKSKKTTLGASKSDAGIDKAERKKKKQSRVSFKDEAVVIPPVTVETPVEKKEKSKKDDSDIRPGSVEQTAMNASPPHDTVENGKDKKRKRHRDDVHSADADQPSKAKRDKRNESVSRVQQSASTASADSMSPPSEAAPPTAVPKPLEKQKDGEKSKKKSLDISSQPDSVEQATIMIAESSRKEKSGEKSKKKKSKKAISDIQPGSVDQVAMDVDEPPQDTTIENKKDRKRKRHHANIDDTIIEKQTLPKQKRAKQPKSESHSHPSTSTASIEGTPAIPPPVSEDVTQTDSAAASVFLTKHSITVHTPPTLSPVTPIIRFDQLRVPEALKEAFKGFKEPTPIQACAWPPALQGHDVVGIAETGSGKTLAFGIPALARLVSTPPVKKHKSKSKSTHGISILVMAPTRELALQTHDTLSTLGAPFDIASVAVYGGVDKAPQINALKNGNKDGKTTRIVVGTPGRILDLVNDGACDLSRVNYLVLDEADRMLDKGFENDITKIISYTMQGADRQTMMFSATWPEAVRRLASSFQRNPVRVTVGSDDLTANSRVEQIVEVFDDPGEKDSRLVKTLKTLAHKKTSTKGSPEARILVFALYKKEASRVESMLRKQGYSVGALHGDMSQPARMAALEKFKSGETGLLVATDVAARGLDIPNVGAVINYTFPLTIEDYIHRIGRTGRGGRSGKSITFFTGENHERGLAGELARVLRDSEFGEMADRLQRFPMTIKKKTHGSYGAFFRDDIGGTATKIVFD